jgi:hypothetical protein
MELSMPTTRRFMDLYKGDNEWLAGDPPTDLKDLGEWHIAWAKLRKDCEHEIEFAEGIYNNQEYGDKPEWIDLTIHDEAVLNLKMARGIIKSINANEISFTDARYFDVATSSDFPQSFSKLVVRDGSAYLIVIHKDGVEEIDVDVTMFFNQTIGD